MPSPTSFASAVMAGSRPGKPRNLTPLSCQHVRPYGEVRLDMDHGCA